MKTSTDSTVYLSTAALVWLFGVLVFLPLAEHNSRDGLSIIASLIVFLAFSVFLVKGLKGFSGLLDVASKRIVRELVQRGNLEKTEIKEKRVKVVLEAVSLLIVYLLYSPLLSSFHPSLNGVAIILTLLAILWTLAKKRESL